MGRARCRGTTRVVLALHDWVVTAISTTARDVDMSQAEGFSHVEALAPRGSCTAFDCVVWVPQPMGACGFQTLIHGASAGGEGSLLGGTSVGAVALTAVTLEAIQGQVLKLQDWALVAFGGVAALQEVEAVVVVEADGAWTARKVATASGVVLIAWTLLQVLVGHHLQALVSRVAALQAVVQTPLTAQV